MVGKPNLPPDADLRSDLMGSSLEKHGTALDQERAASMADEGGAAGAVMDTREQFAGFEDPAQGSIWPRWLLWGACATGSALLARGLMARYRRA